MATLNSALRRLDRTRTIAPATVPNPEKVKAAAAEIRQSWSPRQRRRRAELARYLLFERLLAGMAEAPRARHSSLRITPKSRLSH